MNNQDILALAQLALTDPPHPEPRFPPSPYYRFLERLAGAMHPRLSVELGVCGGGGSLHLALGWPRGLVIGIDVTKEYPDNIDYIYNTVSNFQLWLGDSIDLAEAVNQSYGPTVDILFIDTIHTYERTLAEFNAWQPVLAEGAVVVLDDLHRQGMTEAFEAIPGEHIRLDDLHPGWDEGGFGVVLV